MKLKLFGKEVFGFEGKNGEMMALDALSTIQKLDHLPDFKTLGGNQDPWATQSIMEVPTAYTTTAVKEPQKKEKEKEKLSPKRVYELQMLHDKAFKVNMDTAYIDKQIADFKEKLDVMKDPKYNHRGSDEIGSLLIRLENRKKYDEVKDVFEQFAYTSDKRIDSVIKKHDYLKLGEVDQFVADMPSEAVKIMKDYNTATKKICDKKAVFYIIADKKDFEKTSSRRDPILLAQSPFGHFWQILGVWDKEMMLLADL
jgi:hypothetical protein